MMGKVYTKVKMVRWQSELDWLEQVYLEGFEQS
jgi:hypothetical protein